MKYLLVIILCFFIDKSVSSKNIFELTALSFGIPLLYDQYFDKSLLKKSDFDRRIDLLPNSKYRLQVKPIIIITKFLKFRSFISLGLL